MANRHFLTLCSALAICLLAGTPDSLSAGDCALTVYGGRVTEDKWFESLSPCVKFADAYILVAAFSRTVKSYSAGSYTLEVEGQVARHFGEQDHMEFNLPVVVRRHGFLSGYTLASSAAFGLGPSWATEEPAVEAELSGSTEKFLIHWFAEITLGPKDRNWAFALRLHHRSDAFGLVARDGGSNTLAAGVRFGL